ncbi:uncharacterized protein LOC143145233 isoform X2 [Ptiloglossa arizonensis]|uniref:uncharacterized protein LOC143145233 isoform X2 n=1 Tax=Ptiloglossa arizonensis TaxID=3350558 RepID=UPI003F9FB87D
MELGFSFVATPCTPESRTVDVRDDRATKIKGEKKKEKKKKKKERNGGRGVSYLREFASSHPSAYNRYVRKTGLPEHRRTTYLTSIFHLIFREHGSRKRPCICTRSDENARRNARFLFFKLKLSTASSISILDTPLKASSSD